MRNHVAWVLCVMALHLACSSSSQAPAAGTTVRLKDDATWHARLEGLRAKDPGPTASASERINYLAALSTVCFRARDYAGAEAALRELVGRAPAVWQMRANLSVSFGRQGKYEEAAREARVAIESSGGGSAAMHPTSTSRRVHL